MPSVLCNNSNRWVRQILFECFSVCDGKLVGQQLLDRSHRLPSTLSVWNVYNSSPYYFYYHKETVEIQKANPVTFEVLHDRDESKEKESIRFVFIIAAGAAVGTTSSK
ncbi:hypothetical protein PROFUN_06968 [Planoprotostelium fungivorum]|uniref:Uncharacterized protein n=1 Tax=Planoprotostelium fungivorum TaxID=1890364 RepID=A0A2P6NNB4_9EUKA|nr:hypothetical protein PROFUN_06968 [Planoprotostelium fungivorum]